MFKVFEATNARVLQSQIDTWEATLVDKEVECQGLTWAPNTGTVTAIFKVTDATP